jgi:hypothetical protein
MIINPYLVQPSGPSYGTLTTAWIAATSETDLTILGALNTLESDMATYGLTAKMKALYPMVGGTAGKHSYNFMNTAQYQATFNGGWTHSSTGALPNGTNAYADTGFKQNSAGSTLCMGVYLRTNNDALYSDLGLIDGGWNIVMGRLSGSIYASIADSNPIAQAAVPSSAGFTTISKILSTEARTYKNGALNNTRTVTTFITASAQNFYISAYNSGGAAAWYSNRQNAFTFFSEGLDATENANLYTAVQAFQTTLSRNV